MRPISWLLLILAGCWLEWFGRAAVSLTIVPTRGQDWIRIKLPEHGVPWQLTEQVFADIEQQLSDGQIELPVVTPWSS